MGERLNTPATITTVPEMQEQKVKVINTHETRASRLVLKTPQYLRYLDGVALKQAVGSRW